MTMINERSATACLLLCLLALSSTMAGAAVVVEAPWIREAPPTSRVLAAYMVLNNTGDTVRTITHIESPDFKAAEIHRSVMEDGIAKMLPVEQLQLPPLGSVSLEPGGLHLMLFVPLRPLREGDSVNLVIHSSDGNSVIIDAPVVRKTVEHDHTHHH